MLGTASERIGSILQGSKRQMWRDLFHGRRNRLFFRVCSGRKESFFKLLILLVNLLLFVFEQFLKLINVFVDGIGKISEVIRQQLGISEPHN